ncbi:Beta-xylosidase [Indibacter alkaliphilus LW1]|uniref:Beta-xylosidase n=1 Tax=Indibacter alkaliphilus (strain CCUG 57479 / KCTC 22604 / LW1) TaxID=1189612 RepID=S2D0B8_INDAL|nr:glycoside hydrolase family 43 protein [Indibacter alkaliphilus]EOZ92812.1 Beta-xylosidase [Indibacter alkaliphilus LW1]
MNSTVDCIRGMVNSTGKKTLVFFLVCLLSFESALIAQSQSERKFENPILAGFYPDPGMFRVGDDFYLVTSTFTFFPGVPIFHSTDLVNWRQLGHVLDRPSQMDVDGLQLSEGIFAPTIQHHEGVFYMITTIVGKGGNFVVTATDPAGPWSDPVFLPAVQGIDPSIFFDDDGKNYIIYNGDPPENKSLYRGHRTIRMIEFDTETLKTVGDNVILVNGGVDIHSKPVWIEAPHIYKTRGYYYLWAAEGGTSVNHSQVVFRTKDLKEMFIPYKNNPILTQRHLDPARPNPISAAGHADMVETKNGEWWAVFLATRPYDKRDYYNIGREVFLAPVTWTEDDWPVISADFTEVQYFYDAPDLPENKENIPFPVSGSFTIKDNFDSEKLKDYWVFVRVPKEKWHSINTKAKKLTVQLRPETMFERKNPSFIGRRQQHNLGYATTDLTFEPKSSNEMAGMMLLQNEEHHIFFAKGIDDEGNHVAKVLKATKEGTYEELSNTKLGKSPKSTLSLKVEFENAKYTFSIKERGDKDWKEVLEFAEGEYLSTRMAGGFVGVTMGPYATSSGESSDNSADFHQFTYSGESTAVKNQK